MAKQEITLKGLDGHEDHLIYDAADGQMSGSLEDCARSLFPAEGEEEQTGFAALIGAFDRNR